jgi:hypothetical protein
VLTRGAVLALVALWPGFYLYMGKVISSLLRWFLRPPRVYRISPKDEMYEGSTSHYFAAGRSALHAIDVALSAAGKKRGGVKRILDLPCGHGRVCR